MATIRPLAPVTALSPRLRPGHFGHRNAALDHVETAAAAYMGQDGWWRRALARTPQTDTKIPMLSVIIVIHLMIVLALIGVVLLQKSEGGGLVSSTSGFMTGRGTANVLSRTTAFLAAGFFLTSLALSWLAGIDRKPESILPSGANQETPGQPPASGGGVLDLLKKGGPGGGPAAIPAPAPAPNVPQVPTSQ
jgi:preprotein translocase subunit SecG